MEQRNRNSAIRNVSRDVSGGCLALTYTVTSLVLTGDFLGDLQTLRFASREVYPIPWPFLGFTFKPTLETLNAFACFLLVFSGLVAALKFVGARFADLCFSALPVMLLGFMLSDLRLSSNIYQVILFTSVGYLLTPQTLTGPRIALALCYFFSGIFKCNTYWLSGEGFGEHSVKFLESFDRSFLAILVLILELVGPVILIVFHKSIISAAAVIGFLAFHAISIKFVGLYFPVVMALCLIPIILELAISTSGPLLIRSSRLRFRELSSEVMQNRPLLVFIGCFVALQVGPKIFNEDTDFTGEGVFYGLHVFNRRVVCESRVTFFASASGPVSEARVYPRDVPGRLFCHPLAFLSLAREWCRTATYEERSFERLKVEVDARFANSKEYAPLIRFEGRCADLPMYRVIGSNSKWIVPRSERGYHSLIPASAGT